MYVATPHCCLRNNFSIRAYSFLTIPMQTNQITHTCSHRFTHTCTLFIKERSDELRLTTWLMRLAFPGSLPPFCSDQQKHHTEASLKHQCHSWSAVSWRHGCRQVQTANRWDIGALSDKMMWSSKELHRGLSYLQSCSLFTAWISEQLTEWWAAVSSLTGVSSIFRRSDVFLVKVRDPILRLNAGC